MSVIQLSIWWINNDRQHAHYKYIMDFYDDILNCRKHISFHPYMSAYPLCLFLCRPRFQCYKSTAFVVSDPRLIQPLALLGLTIISRTGRRCQFLHLLQGFELHVILCCYILIADQPIWEKMPLDQPRNWVTLSFEGHLSFNFFDELVCSGTRYRPEYRPI